MNKTEIERKIVSYLTEAPDKAINLLFNHYYDALYIAVHRIVRDEEQSKDIMQDTLVKIWEKAHLYDSEKSRLYNWVYRIATNTAIDYIRLAKNKFESNVDLKPSLSPSTKAFNIDVIDLVNNVDKLHPKYSELIHACYLGGHTRESISEELGIPLGTVKSRIAKAKKDLKKIYTT